MKVTSRGTFSHYASRITTKGNLMRKREVYLPKANSVITVLTVISLVDVFLLIDDSVEYKIIGRFKRGTNIARNDFLKGGAQQEICTRPVAYWLNLTCCFFHT